MTVRYLVVAGIGLAACVGVRDSDRVAWRGVPVIEVERHPFFSTLPKESKQLSDGSELWDYVNCVSGRAQTNCQTTQNFSGGLNTSCTGGNDYNVCCHNQFLIRAGTVEEFRPVGRCRTDCSLRPGGECRGED